MSASAVPYQGYYQGKTHIFALRVYFEDTDLSGIVYHANYLRYMERARSDMLHILGIHQRDEWNKGQGGVYTISQVELRYHSPAYIDDALRIESQLVQLRAAGSVMQQKIYRDTQLLAQGTVHAVFIGPDGRPRRQPAAWRDVFAPLVIGEDAHGN